MAAMQLRPTLRCAFRTTRHGERSSIQSYGIVPLMSKFNRPSSTATSIPLDLDSAEMTDTLEPLDDADLGERVDLSEVSEISARTLMRTVELYQTRLSQEIHDDLGQQVASIAMVAKALHASLQHSHPAAAKNAEWIVKLTQEHGHRVRRLARGLRPVVEGALGLEISLRQLAQGIDELQQIDCAFTGPGTPLALEIEVSNHLYRIAQEAVTNAMKHANASRISIHLRQTPKDLILTVNNNGKAGNLLEISTQTGSLGIAGMFQRAHAIGANLDATPRTGGIGMQLRVTLPYRGVAGVEAYSAEHKVRVPS